MDKSRREFVITAATVAGGLVVASKSTANPALVDASESSLASVGAIEIPARAIPLPHSISPAARVYLARLAARPEPPTPPVGDKSAWRAFISERDARSFPKGLPDRLPGIDLETRMIGGTTVHIASQSSAKDGEAKPHISIHGGGFTNLSGKPAKLLAQVTAQQYGGVVYGIDYRTPPDHPYPVPLDDCLAVYRELAAKFNPSDILVSGGSAGGNLALAMILKARDQEIAMPGALFLDTPATDLTGAGDSLQTNLGVDPFLKRGISPNIELYAGEHDLTVPYLSPINGTVAGFPPTYLRTGTRDLFLSDTVRMHAKLRDSGVAADLYVGEDCPTAALDRRRLRMPPHGRTPTAGSIEIGVSRPQVDGHELSGQLARYPRIAARLRAASGE